MSTVKKKGQNIFIAIADEYYITKNYNFIIILTYLSMIVCIFLDEFMHSDFIDFEKINEFLNHYSSLITILLPLLLLIVPTGIKSIYAMCKKRRYILENVIKEEKNPIRKFAGIYSVEDFDIYYADNLILDRRGQIKKIEKLLSNMGGNCEWVYLTGDSGAGKSTILKLLQKKFDAKYFNRDYYDLERIGSDITESGTEYVFLDQFETALKYKEDIKSFFQKLQNRKIKFVISFRKEFMVDIEKILGHKPVHIVVQDEYDKERMQSMIRAHYKCAEETDVSRIMDMDFALLNTESKIVRILLEAIESDNLQMIAFEIIGTILEQEIDVDEFLREELPPDQFIDSVIDYYFRQILPQSMKEKITMLSILYLLSKDRILAARFYLEDFKNVTFSQEQEIIRILEHLMEIKFVKKVDNRQYEIAHDFIAGKVLYVVSAESMNADIIKNIDYYFHHIYLEKYAIQYNKIKEKLKKRYNAYNSKKNQGITNILMFISSFISLVFFLGAFEVNSNRLSGYERMVIALVVGLSMFYMYNFFMNFVKMFRFFWIPEVVSIAVIGLIFTNMNYWIVCLGIGITVIGVLHAFILHQIDWSARKYLQKNCILFSSFGLSISAVGICELMFQSSGYIKYFWYLFYFLYIMGAIMGHITPDYFAIRIGKANALKVAK